MPALAAPAAQRTAMAGEPPAARFLELEAEAVGSRVAVAESLRTAEAAIDSVFVIPGRVDELLPRAHVVERCANTRIAHPVDAIGGTQEAAHRAAQIGTTSCRGSACSPAGRGCV